MKLVDANVFISKTFAPCITKIDLKNPSAFISKFLYVYTIPYYNNTKHTIFKLSPLCKLVLICLVIKYMCEST